MPMLTKTLCWLFLLPIAALVSPVANSQTLNTASDCRAIGGLWDLNVPRPQFARCALSQYYLVDPGRTLRLGIGVELEIRGGGILLNQGRIEVPNTAQLDVQGVLTNDGTVYADNRAEIYYRRGRVINRGRMDIEGDVFLVNTALLPSGARECWFNFGTITLFSGGNLFNQGGCLDGNTSGVLDIQSTGTFVNEANAFYGGGSRDLIEGTFRNEQGGVARLRELRLAGVFDNHGDAYLTGLSQSSQDVSETRITETGVMRLGSGGEVYVTTGQLRVDGRIDVTSGNLRDAGRPMLIEVGTSGTIEVSGMSTAWSSTSQIELDNRGSISVHCPAIWYPALIQRGNSVRTTLCLPFPLPLPLPLPLPGPIITP